MLGFVAQVDGRAHRSANLRSGGGVLERSGDVGRVLFALIGQGGHGVGQLQRGEGVVSLTDAQGNRLAWDPTFLLGVFEAVALPSLAGQYAAHFTAHVDARELAKTQRFHEIVDGVHAHFVGQRVVIGVARLDDAFVQIHRTHGRLAVAAKAVVAEHPIARVVDGGVDVACTGFQGAQGHERFVGGAWWVGASQGTVEQGLVGRVVEGAPVVHIDAIHEQVGVKGGLADKGQHVAVARINRHQCATAIAEHVFHQFLQTHIDGQHHGGA